MYALTVLHGWGSLLMIVAIFGWSALMLLLVYLMTNVWRPRTESTPCDVARARGPHRQRGRRRTSADRGR